MDPNDGYGARIPTREQVSHAVPKKKQYVAYNPSSTTPVPVTTSSTQKYYPIDSEESYQDISEEPFRPTIPAPPPVPLQHHQHLTETSRGHVSTSTPPPYHSSVSPVRQYRPYSIQPKVKFIPRHQSPPVTIPTVQVQSNPILSPAGSQPPTEYGSTSVSDVLRKLQETNLLPQTLNADNIDDSIQTLVRILNKLKQSQHVAEIPPQQHQSVDYPEQNDDDAIRHQSDYDEVNDKPGNEGLFQFLFFLLSFIFLYMLCNAHTYTHLPTHIYHVNTHSYGLK